MTKYKIGDRVKIDENFIVYDARGKEGVLLSQHGQTVTWRIHVDGTGDNDWVAVQENKFTLAPEKEPELPEDIVLFLTALRRNVGNSDFELFVKHEGVILADKYLSPPRWWPGDAVICSNRLYIRDSNGFWKGNNQPWPGHYTDEAVDAWENKKIIAQKGIVL